MPSLDEETTQSIAISKLLRFGRFTLRMSEIYAVTISGEAVQVTAMMVESNFTEKLFEVSTIELVMAAE
ncbi:hypothetical protein AXF42_Ash002016 [Apostasia shenzhenica]|uniref:Uncharacterized protein n=1 Tax=Apostasia shenzhenica TaxID=1088818 RepID=A0A2I0ABZ4_9ASPA|nr:hypothetical protein AXF42_Ash002016 [Apostasia shenzhenica]